MKIKTESKVYDDGIYDGQWLNDKRHGHGKHTWTTGDGKGNVYEGNWSCDKKNGQGALTGN